MAILLGIAATVALFTFWAVCEPKHTDHTPSPFKD